MDERQSTLMILALLLPLCLTIILMQINCFMLDQACLPIVVSSILGSAASISVAYKESHGLETLEIFILVAAPIFVLVTVGAMLVIVAMPMSQF